MMWRIDPSATFRAKSKFARLAVSSLIGHILLAELFFALPLLVIFVFLNYSEGTLTVAWSAQMIVVATLVGAAFGAIAWFSITVPLVTKHKGRGGRW